MAQIKGVFLALGMLLLVLPILIVSVVMYNTYLQSDSRMENIGKIERMNELDKSVQQGFKSILNKEWKINVSVNNNTVTFNEALTSPVRNIGGLGESAPFEAYKAFVESKYNSSIKVNISDYVLDRIYSRLTIFVKPHMAVYRHNIGGREVTFSPERQEHIAKCGSPCVINGYKITLVVNEEEPTGTLINAPKSCSGATCLRAEIEVKDLSGQTLGTDFMTLDAESSSTAILNFDEKDDAVEIKIEKPAMLTLKEVNPATNVQAFSINATFSQVGYPYEILSATLEENLINLHMEELEIVKTSTATIS